jgi:hypothetical protein
LVAVFCLFSAFSARAQKKAQSKSKVTPACLACIGNFSPTELEFTVDKDKCPKRLANCGAGGSTLKCQPVIDACIAANCASAGACSDESGVRSILYGCLKTEGQFLPYNCKSLIIGEASKQAAIAQAAAAAARSAQEQAVARQQAEVEAQKTAAAKAEAAAKERAAQTEAQAKIRAAEIEAESAKELQRQQAQLEQQAKDAELARQKKAA